MINDSLKFESVEDFVDSIVTDVFDDDGLFSTVIARFNEMKDIVKIVMTYEDINFEDIELASPDINGYQDEYCLSLWGNDGILEICCIPLKVDGVYSNPCGDKTYIYDNCNSKILLKCEGSDVCMVECIADDCSECDGCQGCEANEDCCLATGVKHDIEIDDDMKGFSYTKTNGDGMFERFSFHSTSEIDTGDIKRIMREIGF